MTINPRLPRCDNCLWWDTCMSGFYEFYNGVNSVRAGACRRVEWHQAMFRLNNNKSELLTRADFSCAEYAPKMPLTEEM